MAGAAYRRLLARLEATRSLGVSFGLERMRAALAALGSPERRLLAVQIAGTNGKGSTAAMTESILRAAGLRTGLFTSPHLSRFTERIRIDGREVDGDRLALWDQAIERTAVPLTYFEFSAALAFLAMAEEQVDVAVLETGLGGRLDAVTAAQPIATAITSIGLDHEEFLGSSLRQVAVEKAGILKPGIPVYLGPVPPEAEEEIRRTADRPDVKAPVWRFGTDFFVPPFPRALSGAHQQANGAIAVALAAEVARHAGRPLSSAAVATGLSQVAWPGRLERVVPDVLLDCAHNLEGARALAAALAGMPNGRPRALVASVVRDKDAAGILSALAPGFDWVVATRSRNARSLPAQTLAALVPRQGARPNVSWADNPAEALRAARAAILGTGGTIVVAGSIFLVGELRASLLGDDEDPLAVSDPLP